jgi:hypothetical protein
MQIQKGDARAKAPTLSVKRLVFLCATPKAKMRAVTCVVPPLALVNHQKLGTRMQINTQTELYIDAMRYTIYFCSMQ